METKNTKKRGRPPKENAKSLSYRIRLDSEDRAMLEQLSQESGMSMSDILRKGLRIQHTSLHHKDISDHEFDTQIGTIYVDYNPYCIGCRRYEPFARPTCKTDADGKVILTKDHGTIIDGVNVSCYHRHLCQHVAHELAYRLKEEHNG